MTHNNKTSEQWEQEYYKLLKKGIRKNLPYYTTCRRRHSDHNTIICRRKHSNWTFYKEQGNYTLGSYQYHHEFARPIPEANILIPQATS